MDIIDFYKTTGYKIPNDKFEEVQKQFDYFDMIGFAEAYAELKLIKLLGLDNPFPLSDVLLHLKFATKYLLDEKNYDGHNHEELNRCVNRSNEILMLIDEIHKEHLATNKK